MADNAWIEWNGDECLIRIKNATKDSIKKIALAVEAQAKANIEEPFLHKQGRKRRDGRDAHGRFLGRGASDESDLMRSQIDTGAMINSTRAVFDGLPSGAMAAVISPQEYAPYQEAIRPFLMPAVDEVVSDKAEGIIKNQFNLKKAVGTCFGIFPAQFCKEITVLSRSLRWRRQQVGGGQRPSLEYFGEDPAEDRPPSFVPVQLPRSCFHLQ